MDTYKVEIVGLLGERNYWIVLTKDKCYKYILTNNSKK